MAVIHYDFTRRVKISRDEYLRGADRCETVARTQDARTAQTLARLAESYRAKARQ